MGNRDRHNAIARMAMALFAISILLAASIQVSAQEGGQGGQEYTVQADDSLWTLAEKYLEDGNRFGEIVEATNAKHAEDPSFALIKDAGLILPGSKLWIPAPTGATTAAPTEKPETEEAAAAEPTAVTTSATTGSPTGKIAFSFWNASPNRCTYEINIIDAGACMQGAAECQDNRLIFPQNNVSEPALSADGERIAIRGWGEPSTEDSPYANCAPAMPYRKIVNADLSGSDLPVVGDYQEDSHPDWSPDGYRILVDSARHWDRIPRLFVIEVKENKDDKPEDKGDLRLVGQQPSWAPDNDRFAYRGCDLTGNRCGIWTAHAWDAKPWNEGHNLIGPAVEDMDAAHPDWSPVSEEIVYQSPKNGSYDLYVVNPDGSGLRQLTSDPAIEGLPAWSPDGKWVAYLSDAGGNWGIWVVSADGTEKHKLFDFDGGTFNPLPVEPYGQRSWLDEQISWGP